MFLTNIFSNFTGLFYSITLDPTQLWAIIAGMALTVAIGSIIVYIYFALALQAIGKKLKYKKPWFAWIPFLNQAMILQLGKFHWAWVFLFLIPVLGWLALAVLTIISFWKIFEKRKYPGYLALIPILSIIPFVGFIALPAFLVIMGFVAWKDN